jgi:hypothetical protein
MPSHKFKVGDMVAINPTISRFVPGGVFEVIKQLPGSNELISGKSTRSQNNFRYSGWQTRWLT